MNFSIFMANYWWILVILFSLILYKFILRFLFGMVIVPENRIGLVTKKFVLLALIVNCPMAVSLPQKAKQVSRANTCSRAYTGECGHGNMVLSCNHLLLSPKERSVWYSVMMVLKFPQVLYSAEK